MSLLKRMRHLVEITWYVDIAQTEVARLTELLSTTLPYLTPRPELEGRLEGDACRVHIFAVMDTDQAYYVEIRSSRWDREQALQSSAVRMIAQDIVCVLERAGAQLQVRQADAALEWQQG